jgi:hypothetical protein
MSRDGARLYFRAAASALSSASSTRGRGRKRQIPLKLPARSYASLWGDSVASDSLLVKLYSDDDGEESAARPFWLRPDGKLVRAARGVDHVVEAAGNLYAVNDTGTLLSTRRRRPRVE